MWQKKNVEPKKEEKNACLFLLSFFTCMKKGPNLPEQILRTDSMLRTLRHVAAVHRAHRSPWEWNHRGPLARLPGKQKVSSKATNICATAIIIIIIMIVNIVYNRNSNNNNNVATAPQVTLRFSLQASNRPAEVMGNVLCWVDIHLHQHCTIFSHFFGRFFEFQFD